MADILKLAGKLKSHVHSKDEACTDGPVFNLHCKATSVMLILAAAAISSKEMLGKPMSCILGFSKDKDQEKVVETFCWANSTFIPYSTEGDYEERRVYHAYYQWVFYVLILQAALFYLPKVLWNQWEGELMKNLRGSDVGELMGEEARMTKKKQLADYFVERLQCHRGYAAVYWFCEFLCLVNVVAQVFALDKFFNGNHRFLTYGLYAFRLTEFRADIMADNIFNFPGHKTMDTIFPMQTRCLFPKFGPSGSVQLLDALCILEINSFNRYIFLIMWYWFLILIVVLVSLLLYRAMFVLSPRLRKTHLKISDRRRRHSGDVTNFLAHHLSVSDWWVLNCLQNNISSYSFGDLVLELFMRLSLPKKYSGTYERLLKNDVPDNAIRRKMVTTSI